MRRWTLGITLTLACACAWLGCNQIFGIEPGHLANGSEAGDGGSGEAAFDADGGGCEPVRGSMVYRYVSETTVALKPVDFTITPFSIFVRDEDGGVVERKVTQDGAAGKFIVPDVPCGAEWFVKADWAPYPGVQAYVFTRNRYLDLGARLGGRIDAQLAQALPDAAAAPTGNIRLILTNMVPFDDMAPASLLSAMQSASMGAGYFEQVPGVADNWSVINGATNLDETHPLFAGTPTVSAAKQDNLYVTQFERRAGASGIVAALRRYTKTNAVTFPTDGGTVTVSAAMTDAPSTQLYAMVWDRAAFLALQGQLNPTSIVSFQTASVSIMPRDGNLVPWLVGPDLYSYDIESNTSGIETFAVAAGDPFSASFARIATTVLSFQDTLSTTLDGGAATVVNTNFIQCAVELPAPGPDAGATLRPLVAPPSNVLINGKTPTTDNQGVGVQPTLEWRAPTVDGGPPPTAYWIVFRKLVPRAQPGQFKTQGGARIFTTETKFKFPPGLLEPGQVYFGFLGVQTNGESQMLSYNTPFCEANMALGLMRP